MNLDQLPTSTLLKFCDALDIYNPSTTKSRLCRQLQERANELQKTRRVLGSAAKNVTKKKYSRSQYKQLLRYLFTGAKVVVSGAADVVTLGASGNTITDLLFSVIDVGLLINSIASVIKAAGPASKYLTMIYDIPWTGDPNSIRDEMSNILQMVEDDPDAAVVKEKMCDAFTTIIQNVAAFFGSLISAFIPDSFGIPRVLIEGIIARGKSYAGKGPYEALVYIYSKLPKAARDSLKDKESIQKLITAIVSALKGTLPDPNDPFFTRFKKHISRSAIQHLGNSSFVLSTLYAYSFFTVVPLVPGGLLFMPALSTANVLLENKDFAAAAGNLIERRVVPNIPLYALTATRVLTLSFAAPLVFSRC